MSKLEIFIVLWQNLRIITVLWQNLRINTVLSENKHGFVRNVTLLLFGPKLLMKIISFDTSYTSVFRWKSSILAIFRVLLPRFPNGSVTFPCFMTISVFYDKTVSLTSLWPVTNGKLWFINKWLKSRKTLKFRVHTHALANLNLKVQQMLAQGEDMSKLSLIWSQSSQKCQKCQKNSRLLTVS